MDKNKFSVPLHDVDVLLNFSLGQAQQCGGVTN
jgi:hypothetical protein